jgi:para-nitrobenzyl esterase
MQERSLVPSRHRQAAVRYKRVVAAKIFLAIPLALSLAVSATDRVQTDKGAVEGAPSTDSKVHIFKGIPFAAAPVGALRWKAPQPAESWTGVRKALEFGPRCMQTLVFPDMVFRDHGPSEDCLYLNVWTPDASASAKLPVMVWIYGGGFVAGGTSEPRQDGEQLAKKGVVVVSMNYRLGVFGFFSHPNLAKESAHAASGNYGLLDQVAALQWVRKNIASFGGDPEKVTIFGESAGSFSVSALMASPLAQGLFHRAIGESGAFFGSTLSLRSHAESEKADDKFVASLGAASLEALRAIPAAELLQAASKQPMLRFSPNIDGYFLPEDARSIYAAGKQSHIPLVAGWNSDEGNFHTFFGKKDATAQNYAELIHSRFGNNADALLKLYPAGNDDQAKRSAQDLGSDQFIAYSTWKWIEVQAATAKMPVFRYEFDQAPPVPRAADATDGSSISPGAYHSAEIEFVFEALPSKDLPWRPEDTRLSDLIATYWSNFAKTGDPNGPGLPKWPAYSAPNHSVMHLSANSQAAPDEHRARYEFLDKMKADKWPSVVP